MKKNALGIAYFLTISFILCGLQGSFYFLPIAMPFFWCIILSFYSFRKSLFFSLVTNILHSFVIISFSTIAPSRILITMNILTFAFFFLRERFHTSHWHIALASGAGTFFFLSSNWLIQALSHGFFYPTILSWAGASLMTILVAPPLISLLDKIEQKIRFERIDTLENLRI